MLLDFELLNKRSKSSNIDCLRESGSKTARKKDICNAVNNFICTVDKDFADEIDPTSNPLLSSASKISKQEVKFCF